MMIGSVVARAGAWFLVAVLAVIVLETGYQEWRTRKDKIRFPAPGRLISVGPGRLHLLCKGSGSPTVVISPGAGAWSTHWSLIQRELEGEIRVCTYDRAGLGWSDAATSTQTAQQAANELHELLTAAGEAGPFLLVGESYGGYVCRLLYDKDPEDVAGMVLVESAHERQWEEIPRAKALLEGAIPKLKVALWLSRIGVFRWAVGDRGEDLPGDVRGAFIAKQGETKTFEAILHEIDGVYASAEQVQKIHSLGTLPLVVVSAGKSFHKFVSADKEPQLGQMNEKWLELQTELARLSSNSAHLISREATHGISREKPEFVANAIRRAVQVVRSEVKPSEIR